MSITSCAGPAVTLMLLYEEEYRQPRAGRLSLQPVVRAVPRLGRPSRLSPTMRQAHPAGERLFVDYAGQTVDLIEPGSGEIRPAQIFVAVLGASKYTYAEATLTQSLPDWIGAMFGRSRLSAAYRRSWCPDNPKVGVDRANWYEPGLNRTYLDMAMHYGTSILPARSKKPRGEQGQGRGRRAGSRALDPGAAQETAAFSRSPS